VATLCVTCRVSKKSDTQMEFSTELRKALLRNVSRSGPTWNGTVEAPDFYWQFFDLENLPSSDSRFSNAAGDMWQHTVNNFDWSDDDIVYDERFGAVATCVGNLMARSPAT
jgi:hypothetical protein